MKISFILVGLATIVAASAWTTTTEMPTTTTAEEAYDSTKLPDDPDRPTQEEQLETIRYPNSYKPGTTYIYWYNAQVVTGLPETADQYSGYKLLGRVRLTIANNGRVHLSLDRIQLLETNRILPVDRPVVILPRRYFQAMSDRKAYNEMVRKLMLPMSFEWRMGWVKEIRRHRADQFWSINLKKAIISMLNVNMKFNAAKVYKNNGVSKTSWGYEDGIDGLCQATYVYKRFPYTVRSQHNSNRNLMTMIKNRNLNNCTRQPWLQHALFTSMGCQEVRRPISTQTETRYNFTKAGMQFFLRQMRTISQYSYIPESDRNGSIFTTVVQELNYMRFIPRLEVKLPRAVSQNEDDGLMMLLPIQEMNYIKQKDAQLKRQFNGALRRLVRDYMKNDAMMHDRMRELIEVARKMNPSDMEEVALSKIKGEGSEIEQHLLMHIVPKVATAQAIKMIKRLIEERKVPDNVTAMLVSRLAGMTFVSHDKMVITLMEALDKVNYKNWPETYRSLILTIGQLIHTRYTGRVPKQSYSQHLYLTVARIRQFYKKVMRIGAVGKTKEVREVIAILSLGNCGLVEPCLEMLEELMLKPIRSQSKLIRAQLIYSLYRMARKAPERVRKMLWPIFFDEREDVELRLAAFIIIMQSQPNQGDLKIITNSLRKEKVEQVRSFVLTTLQEQRWSAHDRCRVWAAWNVSRVLDEVPREWFGWQYSRVMSLPVPFFPRSKLFAILQATPSGFLPRAAILRLLSQTMGVTVDVLTIGKRVEEAQRLFERLWGPDGTWRTSKTVQELLRPISEQTKSLDMQYMTFMNMYDSFYGISGLSVEATSTLRKGLIPLWSSVYELITKGGRKDLQYQQTLFADKLTALPTTFGIPFSVNHTLTGTFNASAKVYVPSNLFAKAASAEARFRYWASVRHQVRVGVDMTLFSAFVDARFLAGLNESKENVLRIAFLRRGSDREVDTTVRLNLKRPDIVGEIARAEFRVDTSLQSRMRQWPITHYLPVQHRALPRPERITYPVINIPRIGVKMDMEWYGMNTTGINDLPKPPFYGPLRWSILMNKDDSVTEKRPMDLRLRVRSEKSGVKSVLEQLWKIQKQETGLDEQKVQQLIQENKDERAWSLEASMRMAWMKIPWHSAEEIDAQRGQPIGNMKLQLTPLARRRGISYFLWWNKLYEEKTSYHWPGIVYLNRALRDARFDPSNPLKMIEDARVYFHTALFEYRKLLVYLKSTGKIGDFWWNTIERIKKSEDKVLKTFPDLQKCMKDIKRRLPYSPACYQAWEQINPVAREITRLRIYKDAPKWMKEIPLRFHNIMRMWYGSALVQSNVTRLADKHQAYLDAQLSPYDQRVASIYAAAFNIWESFFNAPLSVTHRNSIMKRPVQDIMANTFDGLYPGKCQVISNKKRITVRTFDRLDYSTWNRLGRWSGRVVLVQDIKERLMVAEERSKEYRAIYIRLESKSNHVLIAVKEDEPNQLPKVMYGGKFQKLPFILRNKQKQVVLWVAAEPTRRCAKSLTVYLPLLGSEIRTHPLIATDIYLDPFFHTSVRGICGDFDGELMDEWKGPNCYNVYRRPHHFVQRYTTILATQASLEQLEELEAMTRFIKARYCPSKRYYPNLR